MIALLLLMACGGDAPADDTAGTAGTDGGTTGGTTDGGTDGGTTDGGTTDGGTGSLDPMCQDAPVVTWESWGEGFIVERCQSCHAADAPERNGAPPSVTFDTHQQVVDQADRVLARAVELGDMPPSGGVAEDELYLLEIWLTCWEGDTLPDGGGYGGVEGDTTSGEGDDPYLSDGDDLELPPFETEAASAALSEVMAAALSLNAQPVLDSYLEAADGMDETCPGWLNIDDVEYWYDDCTALDGTHFSGYGTTVEYVDVADGDGNLWSGLQYTGLATIVTPEGYTFASAGSAFQLEAVTGDGGFLYQSYVEDGFVYDGPAAAGTWLGDGATADVTSYALAYPSLNGHAVYVSGRVLVEDDPAIQAVVFDELFLYDEGLGSPCPEEPAGMVSVLDADGFWFDLIFDGAQWGEPVDAALCDGCGGAWYQGSYLGEVCPDFSPLLDWGISPY